LSYSPAFFPGAFLMHDLPASSPLPIDDVWSRSVDAGNRYRWALWALLVVAIVKLWILPLPSGFWVDEMVTAFVVHHGASHPSLKVAPQLLATNYYWLPWAAERLFGFSEIVYRIPSTLAMGAALVLIARLAQRLIHPGAGWFFVFAALTLPGLNYEAADARPYGLATFIAAGAALFLVRWMDRGRWIDAAAFVIFGATLWRVHLMNWPFYAVLAGYAFLRLWRGEAAAGWKQTVAIFGMLAATLVPVALTALHLLGEAKAHVIVPHPATWREFGGAFKFLLVAAAGVGAWLWGRALPGPRRKSPAGSGLFLVAGWWMCQPVALFAFSRFTGENIFVPRYLSLSLPGAALAATAAAACFLPADAWKRASLVMAAIVVIFIGGVPKLAPRHHNSGWRETAAEIRALGIRPDTPILYPSPFIEAQSPVWHPNFELPGFLYCHVEFYPVGGTPYLLPFVSSPDAERYASEIASTSLAAEDKFVIYGSDVRVEYWEKAFSRQPGLAGWNARQVAKIGDVEAVVFERPVRAEKP
jgi:hypothetical protein